MVRSLSCNAFLKNLTLLAVHAMDESATSKYAKDYFSTKPDLFSRDNLQFIYLTTLNVKDSGFDLIINNLNKFDSVIDKRELRNFLKFIIKRSAFLNIIINTRLGIPKIGTSMKSCCTKNIHFLQKMFSFKLKPLSYR